MGGEFKYEYARPDVSGAIIYTREEAVVELREQKPYTSYIQIMDETETGENCGAVFVAVHPNDPLYDDWFTFSSKVFDEYDVAYAFVKEAGCEELVEER